MLKRGLYLALGMLLLASPNAVGAQKATNGLEVSIEAEKAEYEVGDVLVILFKFKNVSPREITIYDGSDLYRSWFHGFEFRDEAGKEIAYTAPPGSLDALVLSAKVPPGQTIQHQVILNGWNLPGMNRDYTSIGKEPRTFVINGLYHTPKGLDIKDDQGWFGGVTTEPITITIKKNPLAAAEDRGIGRAEADIKADKKRILYYGKPYSANEALVDKESGLPIEIVEGCIVTKEFVCETEAYNRTMRAAAEQKQNPKEQ